MCLVASLLQQQSVGTGCSSAEIADVEGWPCCSVWCCHSNNTPKLVLHALACSAISIIMHAQLLQLSPGLPNSRTARGAAANDSVCACGCCAACAVQLTLGMFFFFALGATGGMMSLIMQGKPIFER
jgi:hypothetical protein